MPGGCRVPPGRHSTGDVFWHWIAT